MRGSYTIRDKLKREIRRRLQTNTPNLEFVELRQDEPVPEPAPETDFLFVFSANPTYPRDEDRH